ncbi:Heparinase II/III-like protein [Desulfocapsa sulfexigens DSM 10523]|uniref:Heparinase II/III-like protein n=1 Tax=Desulfocapsa sulfexigens (strain DSM 10523 / SB164P1) TaxID=1167006 RepID=M1P4D7_DESSD|nr:alginate lyase family protein [Desulfocapsa sulfexigens]AGF78353.1 Heparinase II/III-like protein [Desulfocapsa sulfexigens DSM 10523]
MTIKRFKFYFYRLKRSSLAELRHRLADYLFLKKITIKPNFYKKDLTFDLEKTANTNLIVPKILSSVSSEVITQLLHGKEFTLGENAALIQNFADRWKDSLFVEVKQKKGDPDIRSVWEPARLQHLMILLQHLSADCNAETYELIQHAVQDKLFEWLARNPFLHGPHYMSMMECGLRIPVFIKAFQNLEHLSDAQRNKLLLTIFQHGWLVRNRLSLYSSLGNHTVSESLGLIMAGGLFQQSIQGQEWQRTGIDLLEQECCHQILADGGPAEQSFAYHRFVLDLYWLAIHFLTDNKLHDCSEMQQRVTLGETFMQTIQHENESLPMIGDSDDGFAVAPYLFPLRKILPTSNLPEPFESFTDSGYSLLRDKNGLRVLFDHGILGMEPLNNHGHADCLSIFVSVGDKDFLIDPGTFQYNGDTTLRRYFKSTNAHNTVCIDGRDQARQLTSFVWDHSFTVSCNHRVTDEGQHIVTGTHNGYVLQNLAVSHSRTLTFDPDGILTIEDSFAGGGNHEYSLHFHLHPLVTVEKEGNCLYLHHDNIVMSLTINADTINLLRGQQAPFAGWYSPAYGKKEPTTTIQVIKCGFPDNVSFTTTISVIKE